MIRLSLPAEPYWLDLPANVRLQVRPLNTALKETANARARRLMREMAAAIARRREVGAPVDDLQDLDDPDVRDGTAEFLYLSSLARLAIISWEGVRAAEGDGIAEITDLTVADLMRVPLISGAFDLKYQYQHAAVVAEGNASRPAPNGTGGTGPGTAPGAASPEPPAPTADPAPAGSSAPTSNTNR